ncbi:MAG: hypothetical protein H7067_15125 [Burkholderiales bacterium]|nr:hypothetical protein [Opitutaceae bacterium]
MAAWHLLTFADRRFLRSRDRLVASAAALGAASIHAHDPHSIRDRDWARDHRRILRQPRGAGYWLWKPFLILDTLRALPPGEFLIYCDSGAALVADPAPLLERCARADGLLFFLVHGFEQWRYTKRDCFVLMGCDTPRYWDAPQVNAAFLVLRHEPATLAFVAEWAAWASNFDLITDAPNRCGLPDLPGFVAHRHDQSILALLVEKHGLVRLPDPSQHGEARRREGPDAFPTIFDHHRTRTLRLRERLRMRLGAWRHALFKR